jgi:acetyl esterase
MALFTLFGAVLIEISLARVSGKNGISVSILETFKLPHSSDRIQGTFVPYTMFNGAPVNLVIYRPQLDPANHPLPVLIYVHGGGWISGTPDARQMDLSWFADQGWLVFSIGYTLSTKEQHLWDVTHGQIACSMAWIGTHAARFGGNISRLYMMGDSAGGNLAINASYMANAISLTSSCGGAVPHIRAVVADYPVVDPADFYKNPEPLFGKAARAMAGEYAGGAPEQYPERYRKISSFTYLTSGAPPTMIFVGDHDNLVPPQPTYEFSILARSEGVRVELIRIPYADHAFDMLPHTLGNQIFRNSSAKFMRQH